MKIFNFLFVLVIFFSACSPKVTTSIIKDYGTTGYSEEISVIGLYEMSPINSEVLGKIKIGDSGFTTDCSYETVVAKAKLEARKVGGNAIKITEHKLPTVLGSTCHRIRADILKIPSNKIVKKPSVDEIIPDVDYAIVHVYRYAGAGALVNYDLNLGDEVICRVQNNFKKSIQVKSMGLNTIWAKTEYKAELPIRIEPGHQYYVRCSVGMGLLVGRPKLELIPMGTGENEFRSFNAKHQ